MNEKIQNRPEITLFTKTKKDILYLSATYNCFKAMKKILTQFRGVIDCLNY